MITPNFHILLVEDNPGDIYLFRKALEHAQLSVNLAVLGDGAEFLAYIRGQGRYAETGKPDLIVLDLNLPKQSGTQALQSIRTDSVLSEVPVIVITSSASPRDVEDVQQYGVLRYITKPIDLDSYLEIGMIVKDILIADHPALY